MSWGSEERRDRPIERRVVFLSLSGRRGKCGSGYFVPPACGLTATLHQVAHCRQQVTSLTMKLPWLPGASQGEVPTMSLSVAVCPAPAPSVRCTAPTSITGCQAAPAVGRH